MHERRREDPDQALPRDERRIAEGLLPEIDLDVRVEAAIQRLCGLERDALRARVLVAEAVLGHDPQ